MNNLRLFILTSVAAACVFTCHFVDADSKAQPGTEPQATPALELGDCRLTAEIERSDEGIIVSFWADNPVEAPATLVFNYAVTYTSPSSPLMRSLSLPRPVKTDACAVAAETGRTLVTKISVERETPDALPAPSIEGVTNTPGSWSVSATAGQKTKGYTVVLAKLQEPEITQEGR